MMLRNTAVAYTAEGLHRKAEATATQSVWILESRFGASDVALVPSLNVLGEALAAKAAGRKRARCWSGPVRIDAEGPHGATALHNLAGIQTMEGNYQTAQRLYEEALAAPDCLSRRPASRLLVD